MNQAEFIKDPDLQVCQGVVHGFFTRRGGVSQGLYASLNTGLGSEDDRMLVTANRARVTEALQVAKDRLATPYQIHSADVEVVDETWFDRPKPKVDGVVTKTPGIALGVGSADCCPVLFADPVAGVIGAAHSGWRGAVAGVSAHTIDTMVALGATAQNIRVALGPTISQTNYEVGPEFHKIFVDQDPAQARFFVPSTRAGHFLFSLTDYIVASLQGYGLAACNVIPICTYADEARFYSYRRMTHRKETDYGRQISAIALTV